MKTKIFLSAASLLLLTACSSKEVEPVIIDYNTFANGITFTFDDTLKKSIIKGPVFNQTNSDIKYSLFVDDGVVKMDYTHSYLSKDNKNFYKMVDYRGRDYKISNIKNEIVKCNGDSSFRNPNLCLIKESGIVQLDPKIKYKYQLISTIGQNLDFEINVDYMDAITDFHKKHTSSSKKIRKSANFKHKKLDDLRYGGKDNPAVRVENKRTKGVIVDPIEREEKMKRIQKYKNLKSEQRHKMQNKRDFHKNSKLEDREKNRKAILDHKVKFIQKDLKKATAVEAGVVEKERSSQIIESTTVEETKKVTVLRKIQDTKSEKDAGVKVVNARDLKESGLLK